MSSTAATIDQGAFIAEVQEAERKQKASLQLGDFWKRSVSVAKGLPAGGMSFLQFIMKVIRYVCHRVAVLCGAEMTLKGGAADVESQPSVEFSGEGAQRAAQVASAVIELQAENFAAIAPAFERLKDKNGSEFLKAALDALSGRLDEELKAHTELLSTSEPMLDSIRETLGVLTYEEAFDLLSSQDSPFQGPPVDPNGEFRVAYDKLTRIEDDIKLLQHAIRSYCVAALEIDELRPIADQFLTQPHMSEIKKAIENDIFTHKPNPDQSETIVSGIESRNNLGAGDKVVDLSAVSLAKSRARELPAEFSHNVPASEKAPRGVSRFAGMDKLRAGDMSGAEHEPRGGHEMPEVPNA